MPVRGRGGGRRCLTRIAALPEAPGANGAERRRAIALRALVELVNASHYALGRALASAERLMALDESQALSSPERDAAFCLGVLDLQPEGTRRGREPGSAPSGRRSRR